MRDLEPRRMDWEDGSNGGVMEKESVDNNEEKAPFGKCYLYSL
ncbi:unnamed protein product [Diplocarpon coronariae]|uniref:Uncharacterized protein n=1 Tax=Diplocarpon coronariae TaxID=2795749 RepID=A0A218Z9X2_9HELO|nr:hypothetical protein B2J93_4185 [Marssonina coronariae]